MILTDTHAHLYVKEFDEDRKEMISRAMDSNVQRFFLPNIDLESYEDMIRLSKNYPDSCFPMLGLHPCSVKDDYEEVLEQLHNKFELEKFYGIGEIGIDLYWDKSTLDIQVKALKTQIGWAKKSQLPVILHCRDAFDELIEVLEELNDDRLCGIFHCFTGTKEEAQRVINLGGFKIGIGGVVTFKNAGLAEELKEVPIEEIVLETDSPYLAPHPNRGKRNESANVLYVAQKLSEIYDLSIEQIASITTANSKKIFNI